MSEGKANPNLQHVSVLVPKLFLRHFDEAIEGFYQVRSEGIRRGMHLVLEEIRRFKGEK